MILSTAATYGIEPVTEARGELVWYQLLSNGCLGTDSGMLRRVEAAGSDVLNGGYSWRNQDRMRRFDQNDESCVECHIPGTTFADKAMLQGLDVPARINPAHPGMNWDFVKRLRDSTSMKLVIKGITLPKMPNWLLLQD